MDESVVDDEYDRFILSLVCLHKLVHSGHGMSTHRSADAVYHFTDYVRACMCVCLCVSVCVCEAGTRWLVVD